jgi:hypothetical protein
MSVTAAAGWVCNLGTNGPAPALGLSWHQVQLTSKQHSQVSCPRLLLLQLLLSLLLLLKHQLLHV